MFKFSTFLASLLCLGSLAASGDGAKLKDFEGSYAGYGFSAGGPGTLSSNAFTQVTQFEIDKHGNGTTNVTSYAVYTGPIGTPLVAFSTIGGAPLPIPFTLVLSDPAHIAGKITLSDFPVTGDIIVLDFVAIKRDGDIVEIFEHPVSITGAVVDVGPDNTTILISKRQF